MKGLTQKLNLAKFFLSYNLKLTHLKYPPFFIWVEPTNSCNLRCSICSRDLKKRQTGNMEINLFKIIISQLKEINPLVISLHLAGEPLLHPQLPEMIEIASENGVGTTLSTNGMLLTKELSEDLVNAGLLSVRIDFSPNKEKFEIARSGANWSKVFDNINSLLEFKKSKNLHFPVVKIQNILFTEGEEPEKKEMEELISLFSKNPADEYFHFQTHSWGGEFAANLKKNPAYKLSVSQSKYKPCSHLWNSFVITYDGKVVPCCRDLNNELKIGDLHKNSITEIWESEDYHRLRKLHVQKKIHEIDLCRHCSKPYENPRLFYYFYRYIYVLLDEIVRKRKKKTP
jgi:radical SAM protein with 4Fe4S-binding SPASM domain